MSVLRSSARGGAALVSRRIFRAAISTVRNPERRLDAWGPRRRHILKTWKPRCPGETRHASFLAFHRALRSTLTVATGAGGSYHFPSPAALCEPLVDGARGSLKWAIRTTAHQTTGKNMRKSIIVLSCVFTCLLAQEASAALKYKRFPHCPEGKVMARTCECHAGASGRYHFCHALHYCNTYTGVCSSK
jgi:hypothetical protein